MAECRMSRLEHLPALAAVHARAFPDALSTRQGPAFVARMLEWYVVADRGVLFHVEEEGEIVGYCGGIRSHRPGEPGAFTSISQYAFWSFVRAYLRRPWLLFHPENLRKRAGIARNLVIRLGLRRSAPRPEPRAHEAFRSYWGLVVIGVDPARHGRGYGGVLLREFERLARADGVELVRLSVKPTNRKAIAAYERSGWSVVSRSGDSQSMEKRL